MGLMVVDPGDLQVIGKTTMAQEPMGTYKSSPIPSKGMLCLHVILVSLTSLLDIFVFVLYNDKKGVCI